MPHSRVVISDDDHIRLLTLHPGERDDPIECDLSVAYVGDWTGDTNQLVHTNATKHVTITWGPGMMQSIQVTACPNVTVTIWRVVQLLMMCPSPPCDDGTTPAP